jgi:hypothetical protein
MAGDKPVIWVGCEAEYFLRDDWTGQISLRPLQKIAPPRTSTLRLLDAHLSVLSTLPRTWR